MSKRVLILVGIPDFDYSNQMSAVATFLQTVKAAFLTAGYVVDFGKSSNGTNRASEKIQSGENRGLLSGLKSLLRRWPWAYHSLAYRNYFKRQNILLDELKLRDAYDLVVEFHTAGSYVGMELSKHWKCGFSVVFDSPVDEQFFEMHGTKTVYWSRIQNSEKETLEFASKIMVYSPACESHIKKKYHIKSATDILPCVIHKNSLDFQSSGNDSDFNIGFIGSFLVWHKVDNLLKAFERFIKVHPEAKLKLIGYGVEWKRIKQLVDQSNYAEAVDMPGFVSEAELDEYKSTFSVAIMPGSNWYGSPLKLFEYADAKIPMIAPSSPTVLSIFQDEEHCLYIDSDNEIESIFNHLMTIKNDPGSALLMAAKAKNYVISQFGKKIYEEKLVRALTNKNDLGH